MDKKRFRKRALAVAAATVTTVSVLSPGTGRTVNADTFSLGDVNYDGKVDLRDAEMVLKGALCAISLNDMQFRAADVNLDNKVDLKDAQEILKGALQIEKIEGEITHTHNWQEHAATRQVWVPNMVTVDDYEDQAVQKYYYECDCGEKFDTTDDVNEHAYTKAMEAFDKGSDNPFGSCTGYTMVYWYETEKVKVGSHEEDHGQYENETYVDYYYCDCGATK